jgi:hypothetical protein
MYEKPLFASCKEGFFHRFPFHFYVLVSYSVAKIIGDYVKILKILV